MNDQLPEPTRATRGPAGHSSGKSWTARFIGEERNKLFDLVTSMYLDCTDEEYISTRLSEDLGFALTPVDIRSIRFEAAQEANRTEDPGKRKRWVYRYSQMTLNNLIKEYMFVAQIPNVFAAKVELADELFWLQKTHSRQKLWIGLNEALGRNNIPVRFIDQILDFRERMVRIKELAIPCARREGVAIMELIGAVATEVDAAYRSSCRNNRVKAAQYACELLELQRGALDPLDTDFFADYCKCMKFPDRSEATSFTVIEGADVLRDVSVLDKVTGGNISNLGLNDLRQLAGDLQASSIPDASVLKQIRDYTSVLCASDRSDVTSFLKKLKEQAERLLELTDIGNFCSQGELNNLRARAVDLACVARILTTLNALANSEEVVLYLHSLAETFPAREFMVSFGNRYYKQRFE